MSAESFDFLSHLQVPQSHCEVVGGGRQQAGRVGVELDGVNLLRVSCHWSRCVSIKHYRITTSTGQRSHVPVSYHAEHTPAQSGFRSGLLWESATRGSWHHHRLWDRHIREQCWHSDFMLRQQVIRFLFKRCLKIQLSFKHFICYKLLYIFFWFWGELWLGCVPKI